uniref:Uncharacterized protein n=1 Tax=Caenorhabditis japonica TaxID=281687 RepID=A0A8R1IPG6_CAEJA
MTAQSLFVYESMTARRCLHQDRPTPSSMRFSRLLNLRYSFWRLAGFNIPTLRNPSVSNPDSKPSIEETREIGFAPLLKGFCTWSRCTVLLEDSNTNFEVGKGPRKHFGLQNVLNLVFRVDFDYLIHENQLSLAICADLFEDHHG